MSHSIEGIVTSRRYASPTASRLCADLNGVILKFLLPSEPNVTALAWRVVESIA
jgi:hypothetical protein